MENVSSSEAQRVVLPERTLIVLCGPAGAGKSTFARTFIAQLKEQGYRETSIVSSDQCRALICDDETNQQVNKDTFDLFHYIINKRMLQGRLTIADSTALQAESRQKLLDLAAKHQYNTCLFLFNMSLETCLRYDQHQDRGRIVGEEVIRYHFGLFQRAMHDVFEEGWQAIHVIDEEHNSPEIALF
jgi:predicted kinase